MQTEQPMHFDWIVFFVWRAHTYRHECECETRKANADFIANIRVDGNNERLRICMQSSYMHGGKGTMRSGLQFHSMLRCWKTKQGENSFTFFWQPTLIAFPLDNTLFTLNFIHSFRADKMIYSRAYGGHTVCVACQSRTYACSTWTPWFYT